MNLPNTPKSAEDRRIGGGVISERASSAEDRRLRPDLPIITPAERTRDAEEARLASGAK